jgi:hypothetical protein
MSAGEVFIGIIAVAVSVMAMIQVAAIVAGVRLARRVDEMARQVETDIKPLLTHLTGIASEAGRAATLATTQIERLDRLVADLGHRADQTLSAAQHFISGPAREGMAVVAGLRAAVVALRALRESARRRSAVRGVAIEDDESLFIG